MKCFNVVVLAGLWLLSGELAAQSRVEKPNDLTLELGGKCILYSLSYQRMVGKRTGIEAGFSYVGESAGGLEQGFFLVGGGIRTYLTDKNTAPYLSGGAVFVSVSTGIGPFDDDTAGIYFYTGPGLEFRAARGFVMRGGVNLLFKKGIRIWPGLALGVSF